MTPKTTKLRDARVPHSDTTTETKEIVRLLDIASAGQRENSDVYLGKRRQRRFRMALQVDMARTREPATVFPATMHNISATGIAFWVRREIEPETCVFVREFTDSPQAVWVKATVTHCTVGILGYLIGAEFAYPPSHYQPVQVADLVTGAEEEVEPKERSGLLKWLGLT